MGSSSASVGFGYAVRNWTIDIAYDGVSSSLIDGLVDWVNGLAVKSRVAFDGCLLFLASNSTAPLNATSAQVLNAALTARLAAAAEVDVSDAMLVYTEVDSTRLVFEFIVLFGEADRIKSEAFAGLLQSAVGSVFASSSVPWVSTLALQGRAECVWLMTASPLQLTALPTGPADASQVIVSATAIPPSLPDIGHSLLRAQLAAQAGVALGDVLVEASSARSDEMRFNFTVRLSSEDAVDFSRLLRANGLTWVANESASLKLPSNVEAQCVLSGIPESVPYTCVVNQEQAQSTSGSASVMSVAIMNDRIQVLTPVQTIRMQLDWSVVTAHLRFLHGDLSQYSLADVEWELASALSRSAEVPVSRVKVVVTAADLEADTLGADVAVQFAEAASANAFAALLEHRPSRSFADSRLACASISDVWVATEHGWAPLLDSDAKHVDTVTAAALFSSMPYGILQDAVFVNEFLSQFRRLLAALARAPEDAVTIDSLEGTTSGLLIAFRVSFMPQQLCTGSADEFADDLRLRLPNAMSGSALAAFTVATVWVVNFEGTGYTVTSEIVFVMRDMQLLDDKEQFYLDIRRDMATSANVSASNVSIVLVTGTEPQSTGISVQFCVLFPASGQQHAAEFAGTLETTAKDIFSSISYGMIEVIYSVWVKTAPIRHSKETPTASYQDTVQWSFLVLDSEALLTQASLRAEYTERLQNEVSVAASVVPKQVDIDMNMVRVCVGEWVHVSVRFPTTSMPTAATNLSRLLRTPGSELLPCCSAASWVTSTASRGYVVSAEVHIAGQDFSLVSEPGFGAWFQRELRARVAASAHVAMAQVVIEGMRQNAAPGTAVSFAVTFPTTATYSANVFAHRLEEDAVSVFVSSPWFASHGDIHINWVLTRPASVDAPISTTTEPSVRTVLAELHFPQADDGSLPMQDPQDILSSVALYAGVPQQSVLLDAVTPDVDGWRVRVRVQQPAGGSSSLVLLARGLRSNTTQVVHASRQTDAHQPVLQRWVLSIHPGTPAAKALEMVMPVDTHVVTSEVTFLELDAAAQTELGNEESSLSLQQLFVAQLSQVAEVPVQSIVLISWVPFQVPAGGIVITFAVSFSLSQTETAISFAALLESDISTAFAASLLGKCARAQRAWVMSGPARDRPADPQTGQVDLVQITVDVAMVEYAPAIDWNSLREDIASVAGVTDLEHVLVTTEVGVRDRLGLLRLSIAVHFPPRGFGDGGGDPNVFSTRVRTQPGLMLGSMPSSSLVQAVWVSNVEAQSYVVAFAVDFALSTTSPSAFNITFYAGLKSHVAMLVADAAQVFTSRVSMDSPLRGMIQISVAVPVHEASSALLFAAAVENNPSSLFTGTLLASDEAPLVLVWMLTGKSKRLPPPPRSSPRRFVTADVVLEGFQNATLDAHFLAGFRSRLKAQLAAASNVTLDDVVLESLVPRCSSLYARIVWHIPASLLTRRAQHVLAGTLRTSTTATRLLSGSPLARYSIQPTWVMSAEAAGYAVLFKLEMTGVNMALVEEEGTQQMYVEELRLQLESAMVVPSYIVLSGLSAGFRGVAVECAVGVSSAERESADQFANSLVLNATAAVATSPLLVVAGDFIYHWILSGPVRELPLPPDDSLGGDVVSGSLEFPRMSSALTDENLTTAFLDELSASLVLRAGIQRSSLSLRTSLDADSGSMRVGFSAQFPATDGSAAGLLSIALRTDLKGVLPRSSSMTNASAVWVLDFKKHSLFMIVTARVRLSLASLLTLPAPRLKACTVPALIEEFTDHLVGIANVFNGNVSVIEYPDECAGTVVLTACVKFNGIMEASKARSFLLAMQENRPDLFSSTLSWSSGTVINLDLQYKSLGTCHFPYQVLAMAEFLDISMELLQDTTALDSIRFKLQAWAVNLAGTDAVSIIRIAGTATGVVQVQYSATFLSLEKQDADRLAAKLENSSSSANMLSPYGSVSHRWVVTGPADEIPAPPFDAQMPTVSFKLQLQGSGVPGQTSDRSTQIHAQVGAAIAAYSDALSENVILDLSLGTSNKMTLWYSIRFPDLKKINADLLSNAVRASPETVLQPAQGMLQGIQASFIWVLNIDPMMVNRYDLGTETFAAYVTSVVGSFVSSYDHTASADVSICMQLVGELPPHSSQIAAIKAALADAGAVTEDDVSETPIDAIPRPADTCFVVKGVADPVAFASALSSELFQSDVSAIFGGVSVPVISVAMYPSIQVVSPPPPQNDEARTLLLQVLIPLALVIAQMLACVHQRWKGWVFVEEWNSVTGRQAHHLDRYWIAMYSDVRVDAWSQTEYSHLNSSNGASIYYELPIAFPHSSLLQWELSRFVMCRRVGALPSCIASQHLWKSPKVPGVDKHLQTPEKWRSEDIADGASDVQENEQNCPSTRETQSEGVSPRNLPGPSLGTLGYRMASTQCTEDGRNFQMNKLLSLIRSKVPDWDSYAQGSASHMTGTSTLFGLEETQLPVGAAPSLVRAIGTSTPDNPLNRRMALSMQANHMEMRMQTPIPFPNRTASFNPEEDLDDIEVTIMEAAQIGRTCSDIDDEIPGIQSTMAELPRTRSIASRSRETKNALEMSRSWFKRGLESSEQAAVDKAELDNSHSIASTTNVLDSRRSRKNSSKPLNHSVFSSAASNVNENSSELMEDGQISSCYPSPSNVRGDAGCSATGGNSTSHREDIYGTWEQAGMDPKTLDAIYGPRTSTPLTSHTLRSKFARSADSGLKGEDGSIARRSSFSRCTSSPYIPSSPTDKAIGTSAEASRASASSAVINQGARRLVNWIRTSFSVHPMGDPLDDSPAMSVQPSHAALGPPEHQIVQIASSSCSTVADTTATTDNVTSATSMPFQQLPASESS